MDPNIYILGPENQYQIFLNKQIGKGCDGDTFDCNQTLGGSSQIIKLCAKVKKLLRCRLLNPKIYSKANPNNLNLLKVEYVQFFEKEAKLVVIMERCYMNLEEMFNQKQTFTQEEIFDFLQQFITGYKTLYDNNILHRDIKLDNILIKQKFDGKPQFKLANFGVGKIYKENDFYFTRVGTPIYSPPELNQVHHDPQLDQELSTMKDKKCVIDMYSLGIILYQLTFREFPFKASLQGLIQFFEKIKVEPFKPPSLVGINQEILNLIENLLIYYPSKRLNFAQLYQKYFSQLRVSAFKTKIDFSPIKPFDEVKIYLQKYLVICSNLLNEQMKNQFFLILQQQQWNQNCEWIFNCFSFQPQNSQFYNEQDLSFFICLWSLKNKQAYQLPKNKEQMINFLSQ